MYIKIVDLETVGQLVCQLPQFLWKWKKKYMITGKALFQSLNALL